MVVVIKWNMKKMVAMIVRILKSKFDCFIIIEGNRGLGKSTLALHLTRRVSRAFKREGSDKYKFHWDHSLIYTKKETKRFWHKWEEVGIGDEMINVTFNRDFYDPEQKDIVKMINMNRDHRNLFIACVPQFQTLDSQIKNLCKIRITVVRRGLAIIQTPNQTIYAKDKWDQVVNERIEREWMRKGITHPRYSRLTTFRGMLRFPKLRETSEEKYQRVKNKKRNLVAKEEMGINEDEEEAKKPINIMIKMLQNGEIKNSTMVDGFAFAQGVKPATFKKNLREKLKEMNVENKLSSYYWENKAKLKQTGTL